jgi:chromobox protein 1
MTAALSDDENGVSSGEEEIPYRGKETVPATEEAAQDEADEEGEEDEYAQSPLHLADRALIVTKIRCREDSHP